MVGNDHGMHVDAVVDMVDASCDPLDTDNWAGPSCYCTPQGDWDEAAYRVAYVLAASPPCQEGSEDSRLFAAVVDDDAFSSFRPYISDAVASFVAWHSTLAVRVAVH